MRIAIVDNGIGNLGNLENYISRNLGEAPIISENINSLRGIDLLVLPGVGNYTALSKRLSGLMGYLEEHLASGGYVLAICLGMQILFEESEEGPGRGLGIFRGRVVRLPSGAGLRVPRIGWSPLRILRRSHPWDNLENSSFYYAHSYYASTDTEDIIGVSSHGSIDVPSLIVRGGIVATQFHPERSGRSGGLFAEALRIYMRR
jgi:glutamine amidotransferase